MELGTLERKIAELPDSLKLKLEGYVDALLDEAKTALTNDRVEKKEIAEMSKTTIDYIPDDFESLNKQSKLRREFGGLKGFVKYIADDFDEPLTDNPNPVYGSGKDFFGDMAEDFDEPLNEMKDYM